MAFSINSNFVPTQKRCTNPSAYWKESHNLYILSSHSNRYRTTPIHQPFHTNNHSWHYWVITMIWNWQQQKKLIGFGHIVGNCSFQWCFWNSCDIQWIFSKVQNDISTKLHPLNMLYFGVIMFAKRDLCTPSDLEFQEICAWQTSTEYKESLRKILQFFFVFYQTYHVKPNESFFKITG